MTSREANRVAAMTTSDGGACLEGIDKVTVQRWKWVLRLAQSVSVGVFPVKASAAVEAVASYLRGWKGWPAILGRSQGGGLQH